MKKNILFVMLAMTVVLAVGVNAQDDAEKGSDTVVFEKGKMPEVTFAHHLHQQKLDNDCAACHDLFPMQSGAIKQMISQEKLKKQQVMNAKCVQCHKDRVKAGLMAGPTKCTECHVKS